MDGFIKTCIRKKLACLYKKKKKSNWSHPIEWSRNICAIVAHSVSLKLLDYECMFQFDTFVLFIQYMVLLSNWDELRLIRCSCRFFLYWAWIKRFKTNSQLRNNLRHIFWSWKPNKIERKSWFLALVAEISASVYHKRAMTSCKEKEKCIQTNNNRHWPL